MDIYALARKAAPLIVLMTHAAAQTRLDLQKQTNANIRQDAVTGQVSVTKGFNAPLAVMPFSTTPAFDAGAANVFTMTLSGNVTSSTLTNPKSGQLLTLRICQDAIGGRAFAWPPNFIGAGVISNVASACSQQSFVYDGAYADALGALLITGIPGGAITFLGAVSGTTSIQPSPVAGGVLSLPAATDSLVARNTPDTLTNKIIPGTANTLSPTSAQTISGFSGSCNGGTFLRGDGSCAAGSVPYIPNDQTDIFIQRWFGDLNGVFISGAYAGSCAPGTGSGATGFDSISFRTVQWIATSGEGTPCVLLISEGPSTYGSGTYDFWSGSTPARLEVKATLKSTDTNADIYVGLAAAIDLNDFVGCRYLKSADKWQAVIRSGATDISVVNTSSAHDNTTHRLRVTNAGGMANTITCQVDGGTAAVASGPIPAQASTGWTFVMGLKQRGANAANLAPFYYSLYLTGLPGAQ